MCDLHAEKLGRVCCRDKEDVISLPKTLRRSFLDMYDECPYSLKQTLKYNIDSDGNLWSNVGNILHTIFEIDSLKDEHSCEDTLYEEFVKEFDILINSSPTLVTDASRLTNYDVIEKMHEKAKASIKTYVKYQSTASKPLHVEVELKLTTEDGLPDVTMTLDRIDRDGSGKTIILDYKTGKVFSGKDCVEGFQAPCYLLGFKETYGYLPDEFVFLFTSEDARRTLVKKDDDTYVLTIRNKEHVLTLSESRVKIINHLTSMTEGKWGYGKNLNSFKCENFCGVKAKGFCSGVESSFSNFFRGDK